MHRLFPVLVFVTLGMVAAAACKEHADTARFTAMTCERVYRVCPNVVPANPDEATQCAETFKGHCGAQMRQYIQCAVGKCDDAGAVDRVEAERACLATIEAFRECEESDGGGAGGGDGDEGQLPPFSADASVTD